MRLDDHAYAAYCSAAGGRSLITGQPLPKWDDLKPEVQSAWTCASEKVAQLVRDQERRFQQGRTLTPEQFAYYEAARRYEFVCRKENAYGLLGERAETVRATYDAMVEAEARAVQAAWEQAS